MNDFYKNKKLLLDVYRKIVQVFWGSGISKYKFVIKTHRFFTSQLSNEFIEYEGSKLYLDKKDDHFFSTNPEQIIPEMQVLKKLIKQNDILIDVGANIGFYTLNFEKLIGENGKIFAFEPEPDNFKLLEKNIIENKLNNHVKVFHKAVSNKKGISNLLIGPTSGTNSLVESFNTNDKIVEVDTIVLDEFFSDFEHEINFVKIDTEGHDAKVLQGMQKIIQKNQNIKIMTEFVPEFLERSDSNSENYIELLTKNNMQLHFVDKGKLVETDLNDLESRLRDKRVIGLNLICFRK